MFHCRSHSFTLIAGAPQSAEAVLMIGVPSRARGSRTDAKIRTMVFAGTLVALGTSDPLGVVPSVMLESTPTVSANRHLRESLVKPT